tara:strand:+ start:806 stop:1300 length:495 start_codon:yes stop_codon:yes gene_type:complete
MSKGVNKVIIVGNLGRDPDVKVTAGGVNICNLALATSESWKDSAGQKQERTEWHNCTAFGKPAEIIAQYANKGDRLYIEGKLRTDKWQDKDGNDRYTTKIIIDQFQLLGGSSSSGQGVNKTQQEPQQSKAPQQQSGYNQQQPNPRNQQQKQAEPDFDFDDDIPF